MRALHTRATSPSFAEAMTELSEWFWDGCLDECSELVGEALLASPLAQANFDALSCLDTVGSQGKSAAAEVLSECALQPNEIALLTEASLARPRLLRIGPTNAIGRRKLHEVHGGARRSVNPDHWPLSMSGGDLVIGRLIGTNDDSRWIGPVYPFPSGTPADVILDVRQGLRDLDHAALAERPAATERFLVDLHHQWFFHVFAARQQPGAMQDPPPTFTLLRGSVRPSG